MTKTQVDELWLKETRELFDTRLPKITESKQLFDIRYVDDFFICGKSDDSAVAIDYLRNIIDSTYFEVYSVNNKVYIFPIGLNKGFALQRLMKYLTYSKVICSGDSVLDVPMLQIADIAIAPETLHMQKEDAKRIEGGLFSRKTLHVVKQILKYD